MGIDPFTAIIGSSIIGGITSSRASKRASEAQQAGVDGCGLARKVPLEHFFAIFQHSYSLVAFALDQSSIDPGQPDRVDPVLLAQFHQPLVAKAAVCHQDCVQSIGIGIHTAVAAGGSDYLLGEAHIQGHRIAQAVGAVDDHELLVQRGEVGDDAFQVQACAAADFNNDHDGGGYRGIV